MPRPNPTQRSPHPEGINLPPESLGLVGGTAKSSAGDAKGDTHLHATLTLCWPAGPEAIRTGNVENALLFVRRWWERVAGSWDCFCLKRHSA